MQQQLCKRSYLYYRSQGELIALASAQGGKRLLYVHGVSKHTTSRPVREKQEPRICRGKLTILLGYNALTPHQFPHLVLLWLVRYSLLLPEAILLLFTEILSQR